MEQVVQDLVEDHDFEEPPDKTSILNPVATPSRTMDELDEAEQIFMLPINEKVISLQPMISGLNATAIVKSCVALFIAPVMLPKLAESAKKLGVSVSGALKIKHPLTFLAIKEASKKKVKHLNLRLPLSWDRLLSKSMTSMLEANVDSSSSSSPSEDGSMTDEEGGDAPTSDDDVKILAVIEPNVSAEEIAKARELQLPDYFYAYKQRPDCKGCAGCEKEEVTLEPKSIKEKSPPIKTTSVFGSTTFGTAQRASSEKSSVNGNIASSNINFFMPAGSSNFASFGAQDNNVQSGVAIAALDSVATLVCESSGSIAAPIFGSGPNPAAIFNTSPSPDGGNGAHNPHLDTLSDVFIQTTGEEDEEKIFGQRCKLYRYHEGEWIERGVGEMKLLLHNITGRYRLLLRRDRVHKVALNQLLSNDFTMLPLNNSNCALCWVALNHADGGPCAEKVAVKFRSEEILLEFKVKVAEAKEQLAAQHEAACSASGSGEPAAATIFSEMSRSSDSTMKTDSESSEDQEAERDEVRDFQIGPQPPKMITLFTGEEMEVKVFGKRGKLYRYDGEEWQDRGVGEMKLLHHQETGGYRLLLRTEPLLKVALNQLLSNDFTMLPLNNSNCALCWVALNHADGGPRAEKVAVKFRDEEIVAEFQMKVAEAMEQLAAQAPAL